MKTKIPFDEKKAREIIQDNELSLTLLRVWKLRGYIPKKYSDPQVPLYFILKNTEEYKAISDKQVIEYVQRTKVSNKLSVKDALVYLNDFIRKPRDGRKKKNETPGTTVFIYTDKESGALFCYSSLEALIIAKDLKTKRSTLQHIDFDFDSFENQVCKIAKYKSLSTGDVRKIKNTFL